MNQLLLQIREVVDADLPALLDLYAAAGLNRSSSDTFTPEEARSHLALFRQYPNYKLYVATVPVGLREQLVGSYALLIMDNLAKRGLRSAIVEDVCVDPGLQGQGIGRSLMDHAMAQARAAGCYKLTLSSNLRRGEAHAFYDALGFERHGYSFLIRLEADPFP